MKKKMTIKYVLGVSRSKVQFCLYQDANNEYFQIKKKRLTIKIFIIMKYIHNYKKIVPKISLNIKIVFSR